MQPIWHGLTWPSSDYSRVPYGVFSDPRIYAEEQELIFRGPVWTNIALEAEIPEPGDYRSSYVGDTPVVAVRGQDGAVRAFVNRCAHRGTLLVRDGGGNVEDFTCVYHHWCYDLEGNLIGVPFRRGLKGKGGMPGDFRMSEHGLRRLRVECYRGAVFATFDDDAEDIRAYLGADGTAFLDRLFHKPIRILGYMRQRIPANWKLYLENLKDANHAGLLHQMPVTFGLWRNTQTGGSKLDARKRHEIHYGYVDTDTEEDAQDGYDGVRAYNAELTLNDSRIVDYVPEWGDDISSQFLSMFPASVFQQFANTIATRQVRPRKTDEFELFWTVFGYADDDEEALRRRIMQNNLAGPAGVVSMEDGEAPHLVQRAVGHAPEGHSLIAYGGTGPIEDQTTVITEVAVRGFWKYYCELMRVPVAMAAQAAE
ncbi:MAG: Rieske 2Fe-2S domain-containing protein [Alphaproteobacteria bacterium]|nr:Rieske 2Fe-2S domain-containing protein [Alphaproteobacteria bacterium]